MREDTIASATFWGNGIRMAIALHRYDDGRLSMTGECAGGLGQCQDRIEAEAGDSSPALNRLLEIWEANHLKPTPDSIFAQAAELIGQLDGQRIGTAPDLDEAPEVGGEIMDSRNIISRLEIYRTAVVQLGIPDDEADTFTHENWPASAPDDFGDDEEIVDEFLRLRDLNDAGAQVAEDWAYGSTLIREDYFTEFAEDTCKDCGYVDDDVPSWIVIDWEKTAENMKADYSEVEYDGNTYFVR